jgi:hypothetical protein
MVSHLFTFFRLQGADFPVISLLEMDSASKYLSMLRKQMTEEEKKWIQKTKNKEALLANRHFPRNGLSTLRTIFDKVGPYFALLCQLASRDVPLSRTEFEFCFDFTIFSLYALSPNARPQALDTLTVSMMEELINTGLVDSQSSKTALNYGGQTIIAHTAIGKYILQLWLHIIRPQAVRRWEATNESHTLAFTKYSGGPISRGTTSRSFTHTTKTIAGLRCTTTDYRALLETMVHNMEHDAAAFSRFINAIAMHFGQGHSNPTVRLHYLKITREECARVNSENFDKHLSVGSRAEPEWWAAVFSIPVPVAAVVAGAMLGSGADAGHESSSDDGASVTDGNDSDDDGGNGGDGAMLQDPMGQEVMDGDIIISPLLYGHSDWGRLHPHRANVTGRRIPWTREETFVYVDFLKLNIVGNNKWQMFLEYIICREECRHVFHFHHVSDCVRLHQCERVLARFNK